MYTKQENKTAATLALTPDVFHVIIN